MQTEPKSFKLVSALRGFTLSEILIGMSILAFGMLPVMGIIWSGVSRTDISVTYENASQLSASVLEYLLSDAVKFESLDFSNPSAPNLRDTADSKESSGLRTTVAATNEFLGKFCKSTCSGTSKDRYFKVGRENYYTDLYIGAYFAGASASPGTITSISYSYLANPVIDYEGVPNNPQLFYDTLLLTGGGGYTLGDYSPYMRSTEWSLTTAPIIKLDNQVSLPWVYTGSDARFGASGQGRFTNFAKIQLFTRWGLEWQKTGTDVTSRGGAKIMELVTFKGRL